MRINLRGLTLVKHYEGCQLRAYRDEVNVWTIGYGHTGLQHRDGTVYPGRTISQGEVETLLAYDMRQFEARLEAWTLPRGAVDAPAENRLSWDQFSALVAWDFNTGALDHSTIGRMIRGGKCFEPEMVAAEFSKWVFAGGRKLRGLQRRRESERRLFLGRNDFLGKDIEAMF